MSLSTSRSEPLADDAAVNPAARSILARIPLLGWMGLSFTTALALLWAMAAFGKAGFLDPEYGMWTAKQEMVQSCALERAVIMGDSRAVADLDPAQIPQTTNLALGAATPIEMYYVTERMLSCPHPPSLVLLNFSPMELVRDRYFWVRTAIFGFASFAELEQIRRDARSFHDTSLYPVQVTGDFNAIFRNWLSAHSFPSFYLTSMVKGHLFGRLASYRRVREETIAGMGHHGYGTARGTPIPAEEAEMTGFTPSPMLDAWFDRMLRLLADAGTEVVLVATPWSVATCAALRPEMVQAYSAYLRSVAARHANVRMLGEPVTCLPDTMFGDPYHLNAEGVATFSRHIAALLAEQHPVASPAK